MSTDDPMARYARVMASMRECTRVLGVPDWTEPDVETGRPVPAGAHPEDRVIDAIDELVSEQLAAGCDRYGNPLDDYNADRYPDCDKCPHQWHGLHCPTWQCRCVGSAGEVPKYVDQIESVRYEDTRDRRGYTMADVEAMRSRVRAIEDAQQPLVRLWGDDGSTVEIPGTLVQFYGVVPGLSAGEQPDVVEGELVFDTRMHAVVLDAAVDATVDAATDYALGTIAELVGIPPPETLQFRQARRGITWDIPDGPTDIDVESWFGGQGELPAAYRDELDEALAAHRAAEARCIDIDEQAELDCLPIALQAQNLPSPPWCRYVAGPSPVEGSD